MGNNGYTALVFGASGISGWAIMRQCLGHTSSDSSNTFSRVIGLTNRPLSKEASLLNAEDERWELHSGIDLEEDVDAVAEKLKVIQDVDQVTHVYFTSYTAHGSDYQTLKRANVAILSNALRAVEKTCPSLVFWTLQTGGKAYGVEFLDKGIKYEPPLEESAPRIPEPWASNVFYYAQYDTIKQLSEDKKWTFCEIRPDAIIGFVPQNNAMNLAHAIGLWLAMVRSLEGTGTEVVFPGDEKAFKALHTDTSQDVLAQFHIYASLHPEAVSRKAFNIADGEVVTWEQVWPSICHWFGLKGVGPDPSKKTGAEWVQDRKGQWGKWVKENGLKVGALEATSWDFMSAIMGAITFDRQYDLSACRAVGFQEKMETVEGYTRAFERMRVAKIIPSE
ncbi:hypothetical protein HO173_000007 [Letharia columbiana]|uniref:PRISE-like Rossmann-fold domain-containing protein n=1 Tax=Letharia columbiana TaxID=112416 RepID=A0A8H6G643_9LECA|nr:uncharacterized protein HO173_000007 [Letharia columbiana]KAF6241297.1 hypothetical protein HO173_000007 [Letharia columbiana]